MPGSRKAEAKLKSRIDAFNSHGARPAPGNQEMHKPGSQNRNK